MAHRLRTGLAYARGPVCNFASWLFTSKEHTNFTYDLTDLNKRYLAAFVSQVAGVDYVRASKYIAELDQDSSIRAHIRQATESSKERRFADADPEFGRRLGWYAIVRSAKPRVVVETGVDKGLGSCVLACALMRNSEEGHPGRYYGTDINPSAGYLFQEPYADFGEILYGDSIDSLRDLDGPIDVFIHDSDHSADYEAREYSAVQDKLSESAVVISDNAHATGELLRFSRRTGRQFLFFKEQPDRHWYPGGGIGAAFKRGV